MKTYLLPENVRNALIQYFQRQEAVQIIQALSQLQENQEAEPEVKNKTKK